MKLLIVEDDLLLQEGLALGLANEGYALDCAGTAAEADALIQSGEYSLVILDLGLPDKDGATLLSQWRRRGINNPVLILTARDAIEDRITGLDAGADDYLVKPFALAELQARVRALIRRYQGHSDNLLTDGDITLNLQTPQVLRRDQTVDERYYAIGCALLACGKPSRAVHSVDRDVRGAVEANTVDRAWRSELGSGEHVLRAVGGVVRRAQTHHRFRQRDPRPPTSNGLTNTLRCPGAKCGGNASLRFGL